MKLPTLALAATALLGATTAVSARIPEVARLETELGASDGIMYPDDPTYGHSFMFLGHPSSQKNYLPSTAPFRGVKAPPKHALPAALPNYNGNHLERRYVHGFTAPTGYDYSWVKDGYRLAIATNGQPSYLTRYTVQKSSPSTTQQDVQACTNFCERTPNCAMASLIRFQDFPEGDDICAVYSATAPASDARYTTGLFNGPGTVKASYTFNRKAGKVPANVATTTARSGITTVRTSSSAATPTSTASPIA